MSDAEGDGASSRRHRREADAKVSGDSPLAEWKEFGESSDGGEMGEGGESSLGAGGEHSTEEEEIGRFEAIERDNGFDGP